MRRSVLIAGAVAGGFAMLVGVMWLVAGYESHRVRTPAMADELPVGSTVLYLPSDEAGADLRRGDVVIVDGSAWPDGLSGPSFPIRIVGLPGDSLACCDPDGRLLVNGVAVTEDYAHGGTGEFAEVEVPAGRLFLLGDLRDLARDSRAYLDHEGGTLPVEAVEGRAVVIVWPPWRLGGVGDTSGFEAGDVTGLPARGSGHWYAITLIIAGGVAVLAVGGWGTGRWWLRRSGARERDSAGDWRRP